jgi:glyoxylase-like metal-dependent hydrolase (beta-lactamase superfamily II)
MNFNLNRCLLAGDHCVGVGSAVLDWECGDMLDYFLTTEKLIKLRPNLVLPAHGPPVYNGVKLLQQYWDHRKARENAIERAIREHKCDSVELIVVNVYGAENLNPILMEAAKSNVKLHLRKLRKENKLTSQDVIKGEESGIIKLGSKI